jgi:hypothetical protein
VDSAICDCRHPAFIEYENGEMTHGQPSCWGFVEIMACGDSERSVFHGTADSGVLPQRGYSPLTLLG